MKWQSLRVFPIESWFSENLAASAAELNRQIEAQLAGRRQFDIRNDTLRAAAGVDILEIDFDKITLNVPRSELAKLLQDELRLRTEIATWLAEQWRPAVSAWCDELAARLEENRGKVRAALERLGYHEFQASTPDPARWFPGWIEGHPTVHALRSEHQAAGSMAGSGEWLSENHRAAGEVTRLLERLRDDAVAAANLAV